MDAGDSEVKSAPQSFASRVTSTDHGGGSGGLVSSRPRAAERLKGIGKLSESSLPRCPKATTVALKQENAFARQTAATIARTDGRGSFWPKLGSCRQGAKRSIEQYRRITVKIS
jgi:hypothetical protein